ncbi:MAG: YraN family protein, partial [Gammaproteobacteria bacterium]|nr:YraN family protein [Gammaproteobacteria bacterium]
ESYLAAQGLRLITANYLCKTGEIDLIMRDQADLVFVEVRFRKGEDYGDALESVTRSKQLRVIRAAQYYLQENPQYADDPCRFDVVAIAPDDTKEKIVWIKDAFWVKY